MSDKPLNKYEILLNEAYEAAVFIEENPEEPLCALRDLTTIYENMEGFEVESTFDVVKLLKDMRESISTLSEFIKTAPIDPTKRLPMGMPPLAIFEDNNDN